MLYRLMRYLFPSNEYRYTPKPWHLPYSLVLIAIGTITIRQGWLFFGFMSSFFGVLIGLTIILGMNWDKAIEYWQQIEYVLEAASKIKDTASRYELLKSMGYNIPPSKIEIIETHKDDDGVYAMEKTIIKGLSPTVLQMIADKVLMSGKTEFAEEEFGRFVPAIRRVRKLFKEGGLIAPKNKGNVRLGYSFTKKGMDTLYQSASEGVRLQLMRERR